RLRRERHVEGQDVGPPEEVLEGERLDPHDPGPRIGNKRIVADAGHLEATRALRDGAADLAQPDDAERLAPKLPAHVARLVPLAALDRRVGGPDLPEPTEEAAEDKLRHGHRVRPG